MSAPASTPDKARIVAALLEQVQAELDGMEAVAEAARDEATSSETKAEGKYDTPTEASYLARGQAWYRCFVNRWPGSRAEPPFDPC